MERLVVDMLGTRGLPNRYGGSETCVEEVGSRLARAGQEVRVYCRRRVTESSAPEFRGMSLVYVPSIPVQVIDTLSHSAAALAGLGLRPRKKGNEVAHFHGSGNGAVLPLARLLGVPTVVTVDGADWERAKWGPVARRLLKLAARMTARMADVVVADSRAARGLYEREFGISPWFIPYGAPATGDVQIDRAALAALGLEPGGYLLFVGRMVPEKEVHTLTAAHAALPEPRPALVLVGGEPGDSPYAQRAAEAAADDCRFLGKLFGDQLSPVLRGALGYVQPSAVEGTSPMLLTAMSYALPIVASDIPEIRETVGEAGMYFRRGDVASLTATLAGLIGSAERGRIGMELRQRALAEYSWDAVTARYEEAYKTALSKARRATTRSTHVDRS